METQLVRLTSDVLMKIFIRGSPVAGGSQVWSTETGDVTKIEISGCHNLRPFVHPIQVCLELSIFLFWGLKSVSFSLSSLSLLRRTVGA